MKRHTKKGIMIREIGVLIHPVAITMSLRLFCLDTSIYCQHIMHRVRWESSHSVLAQAKCSVQRVLAPSQTMAKPAIQSALSATTGVETIMNAIVFFTHPSQYHASVKAQENIKKDASDEHIHTHMDSWPSIFTGHTWVVNWTTPAHCDSQGFKPGFDYLSVSGSAKSKLILRDISLTLEYTPGCVVGLAGQVLTHQVNEWEEGDWVCVARWIRQNVLQGHGVNDITWPTIGQIGAHLRL
jgi:hypothetical protein